ncbi:MAG: ChaN family lipoprotein, partial [Cyanobacteriota bacterium]
MGKHGHRPLLRFLRSPSRPGPFWRGLLGCQLVVQLIVPASPLHEAHSSPLPAPLNCAAAVAAENQQLGQLLQRASRLDVVLLGEIHTSAADHAWQLRTLEALAQRHKPLALGLEMVPTARQPALSRFSRGELDEAGFLAAVDWPRVWGHDPELYLPILRWARRQGVPLLALNVEAAVVKRVRRDGLAAIPPADREGIGNPRPAGATYRQ